jgi:hypothetical protein
MDQVWINVKAISLPNKTVYQIGSNQSVSVDIYFTRYWSDTLFKLVILRSGVLRKAYKYDVLCLLISPSLPLRLPQSKRQSQYNSHNHINTNIFALAILRHAFLLDFLTVFRRTRPRYSFSCTQSKTGIRAG